MHYIILVYSELSMAFKPFKTCYREGWYRLRRGKQKEPHKMDVCCFPLACFRVLLCLCLRAQALVRACWCLSVSVSETVLECARECVCVCLCVSMWVHLSVSKGARECLWGERECVCGGNVSVSVGVFSVSVRGT